MFTPNLNNLMSRKQRVREIDGLRALALLGVLLYHARLGNHVSGGFLGVDMFFVISGRILRLLPALVVVLNATNALFLIFIGEDNRKKAGMLSISSLFSVSNIHLWMESDYFDENVRIKPYLHTWSLSVEWQFYLVWAALSSFVFNKIQSKSEQLITFGVISCVCLEWTEITKIHYPSAAFYNLPFRYFEFMIGAIPAWNRFSSENQEMEIEENSRKRTLAFNIGSIVAAVSTCGMLYYFNDNTSFPGLSAVPICTTTIFLIMHSNNTIIGAVLRSSTVQWLGTISYSVYLVHWPLLVLVEFNSLFRSSITERIGAIILSIIMGNLLNNLVEIPFYKSNTETFTTRLKMKWLGALVLLLLINGCILQISNLGIGQSIDQKEIIENTRQLFEDRKMEVRPRCRAVHRFDNLDHFDECNSETQDEIVLLGDSHACGLWHALNMSLPDTNVIQICGTGCGLAKNHTEGSHCYRIFSDVKMGLILKSRWDRIRAVFFVSRWPEDLTGNEPYLHAVVNYFKRNTKAKLFVLGPRPEFVPPPTEVFVLAKYRDLEKFDRKMQQFLYIKWEPEKALRRFSENAGVQFVSVIDNMCQRSPKKAEMNVTDRLFCSTINNDHSSFVYIDSSHYNRLGALVLTNKLKALVNSLMTK